MVVRDHRKLRAFELADKLTIEIYLATKTFPREEQFGLTSQMRRAAVSVVSNIVEGCARHSQADYLRFLDMAYASGRELAYQMTLARRLGYLEIESFENLSNAADETNRVLAGLLQSLRSSL